MLDLLRALIFYNSICILGDTAQTIAHGVGFRFQTLKDIFFKHNLAGMEDEIKHKMMPMMYSLTMNFRTHNGILRLARSIVDLIVKLFPDTIDKMKSERSEYDGPRPIFLKVT